ncbi:O-linked GlcNAc transferase, partial [Mesorhizobium sp. M7A.F.Ca.CA.001.08.2.1]
MTAPAGAVFGTIGALAAFPLRLAAREVERQHGQLRRGVTRRTT